MFRLAFLLSDHYLRHTGSELSSQKAHFLSQVLHHETSYLLIYVLYLTASLKNNSRATCLDRPLIFSRCFCFIYFYISYYHFFRHDIIVAPTKARYKCTSDDNDVCTGREKNPIHFTVVSTYVDRFLQYLAQSILR